MNRLDQVIKLLREQRRSLESDRRDIDKAMHRVDKALAAMGASENGVATSTGRTRVLQGPVRMDTAEVVLDEVAKHVNAGDRFTRIQAMKWCSAEYRPTDPLRQGQVAGGLRKLVDMGILSDTESRGTYAYGSADE